MISVDYSSSQHTIHCLLHGVTIKPNTIMEIGVRFYVSALDRQLFIITPLRESAFLSPLFDVDFLS